MGVPLRLVTLCLDLLGLVPGGCSQVWEERTGLWTRDSPCWGFYHLKFLPTLEGCSDPLVIVVFV